LYIGAKQIDIEEYHKKSFPEDDNSHVAPDVVPLYEAQLQLWRAASAKRKRAPYDGALAVSDDHVKILIANRLGALDLLDRRIDLFVTEEDRRKTHNCFIDDVGKGSPVHRTLSQLSVDFNKLPSIIVMSITRLFWKHCTNESLIVVNEGIARLQNLVLASGATENHPLVPPLREILNQIRSKEEEH
jgi:hypothetical protein